MTSINFKVVIYQEKSLSINFHDCSNATTCEFIWCYNFHNNITYNSYHDVQVNAWKKEVGEGGSPPSWLTGNFPLITLAYRDSNSPLS